MWKSPLERLTGLPRLVEGRHARRERLASGDPEGFLLQSPPRKVRALENDRRRRKRVTNVGTVATCHGPQHSAIVITDERQASIGVFAPRGR